MSAVVLGIHPTVHAAYQANPEAIGVSTTALYNKLDRVETGVFAALVRDSAELAEPVIKALGASPFNMCLKAASPRLYTVQRETVKKCRRQEWWSSGDVLAARPVIPMLKELGYRVRKICLA